MLKYTLTLIAFVTALFGFSSTIQHDIIVDRAGRGHFRNVQEALDSVKKIDTDRTIIIFIRDGIYKEKIDLTADINNIRLTGESRDKTIITYDDHAGINNMRTFKTYTFRISGNDLIFENLTIENSALQLGQAVAAHIEGDRVIFKNCKFLGNQDTIYAGNENSRQYFENCYIEGTTDFIFGPSTAWFENCDIFCKKDSYIAAGNTPENVEFGYIFNNCKVRLADGIDQVYLGRPWRPYAMTLFMNCDLGKGVRAAGWHNWDKETNEKTARFIEYNNFGEGSSTAERVKWSSILNEKDAWKYTLQNVLKGSDNWNPLSVK